MDRFERELGAALKRSEPSADFTARVMEAVRAEGDVRPQPVSPPVVEMPSSRTKQWRFALAGALAASLTFGVVLEKRRADRAAAEEAETQLVEMLLLTGSKINQARDRVLGNRAGGE